MSQTDEQVIGTRKAAEMLGVSVRTVQLWVENGTLQAWKTPGNHRRILKTSIDRVLKEREEAASDTSPAGGSGNDLLIVEDEATMQAYYQALLDVINSSLNVRFAADGFEGLIEFGKQRPALMLVDVDMPGMNGLDMIASLRQQGSDSGVGIVVVTGLSGEQLAARGNLPAGVPVFNKPLGIDDLQSIVKDHFASQEAEA